jgi:dihydrolipoamide dehydrogenase
MGNFVLMPKLGMTMTDGKIVKWLKNEGDHIEKGDYIFEVETDKTTLEVDSLYRGILIKKLFHEGDVAACDTQIAYIGEAGENVPVDTKPAVGGAKQPVLPDDSLSIRVAQPLADDGAVYEYDLAVVGGGPGGYVAAIRAAQLGAKTVLIEKDQLGGTCLNRGCIPTKALYTSAGQWRKIARCEEYGFRVSGAELDFSAVMQRKDKIVRQLTGGVAGLLKKNKVSVLHGEAEVAREHEVILGDKKISSKYILLATGGRPASLLKNVSKDVNIINTDTFMDLKELPRSIVIVGGGIIGCEIGCILNAFGAKVTIVEMLPAILPMTDDEISSLLMQHMTKNGMDIRTSTTVNAVEKKGPAYSVILSDNHTVECDMVLEAVGRVMNDEAFRDLGLKRSQKGFVDVDSFMGTNLAGVYAIGDITGICQLAHAASTQGVIAAERMFGGKTETEEQLIPSCIFTDLEIAYVGMTEKQAKEKGLKARVFKYPFSANGKALTLGESEGFVKIICDERFDEILGVHIIGAEASTLIHEAVMAMRLEATSAYAGTVIHAHPTLSEALMEAFLGLSKGAVHI